MHKFQPKSITMPHCISQHAKLSLFFSALTKAQRDLVESSDSNPPHQNPLPPTCPSASTKGHRWDSWPYQVPPNCNFRRFPRNCETSCSQTVAEHWDSSIVRCNVAMIDQLCHFCVARPCIFLNNDTKNQRWPQMTMDTVVAQQHCWK